MSSSASASRGVAIHATTTHSSPDLPRRELDTKAAPRRGHRSAETGEHLAVGWTSARAGRESNAVGEVGLEPDASPSTVLPCFSRQCTAPEEPRSVRDDNPARPSIARRATSIVGGNRAPHGRVEGDLLDRLQSSLRARAPLDLPPEVWGVRRGRPSRDRRVR